MNAPNFARIVIWSQVFTRFFQHPPDAIPWLYVAYTFVLAVVFEVLAWRDRVAHRAHLDRLYELIDQDYAATTAERTETKRKLEGLAQKAQEIDTLLRRARTRA